MTGFFNKKDHTSLTDGSKQARTWMRQVGVLLAATLQANCGSRTFTQTAAGSRWRISWCVVTWACRKHYTNLFVRWPLAVQRVESDIFGVLMFNGLDCSFALHSSLWQPPLLMPQYVLWCMSERMKCCGHWPRYISPVTRQRANSLLIIQHGVA